MSVVPCPFCGSETACLMDNEGVDEILYRHYDCSDCGGSFVEVFQFSHVEDEDEDGIKLDDYVGVQA